MSRILAIAVGIIFFFISLQLFSQQSGEKAMKIQVTSTAFQEGGMIPPKYTCKGANVSPPLAWSNIPEGTKSIALINDDPDAPVGIWVHWILFNIPPETKKLEENIPPKNTLQNGARHGITDFRKVGYGGPCPPSGTHRYFFKIYALDKMLDKEPGISKAELLDAMKGHILAEGQLIGKFSK